MSQIPLLNAWPGGLLCPWTRGTVDAVACQESTSMVDRDAAIARELNRLIEGT
jgi:hypothetical protein